MTVRIVSERCLGIIFVLLLGSIIVSGDFVDGCKNFCNKYQPAGTGGPYKISCGDQRITGQFDQPFFCKNDCKHCPEWCSDGNFDCPGQAHFNLEDSKKEAERNRPFQIFSIGVWIAIAIPVCIVCFSGCVFLCRRQNRRQNYGMQQPYRYQQQMPVYQPQTMIATTSQSFPNQPIAQVQSSENV